MQNRQAQVVSPKIMTPLGHTVRLINGKQRNLCLLQEAQYTEEQRNQLIKSMQSVSWPPTTPFTDDFDEILERALQAKQAAPNVEEISE